MLATDLGGSEPTPDPDTDDEFRGKTLEVFAALGSHLLVASRALDGPTPRAAVPALRQAAALLRPYLT